MIIAKRSKQIIDDRETPIDETEEVEDLITRVQHCSRLTKREQQLQKKGGSILIKNQVLDTALIHLENKLEIILLPN